jgi:hypothetical protein
MRLNTHSIFLISSIISCTIAYTDLRYENCVYGLKMLWEFNPKPRRNTWSFQRHFSVSYTAKIQHETTTQTQQNNGAKVHHDHCEDISHI